KTMHQTNEKAFESYVEEILLTRSGWQQDTNVEWDKELALFPKQVVNFLRETQPEAWGKMAELHCYGLESQIIRTLAKKLDLMLRHGFKFYGKPFRLA
ncbi:hypothetical protein, partial [Thiolapillus sp.]|uniref:hypothetical protein n=2 Tax=Thiolapillus sp. TaxID=2017437 RepID=UPI003AF4AFBC